MEAKVECAICGYKDHILLPHLKRKHGIVGADVIKYMEEHDAAWASSYGMQRLSERRKDLVDAMPKMRRPRVSKRVDELFPGFCEEGEEFDDTFEVYTDKAPYTPRLDPFYVFPEAQTLEFLTIIEKPVRNNVWFSGYTGAGKTSFVRNCAAIIGAEVMELNADGQTGRVQLIGKRSVVEGSVGSVTKFQHGIVPIAMQRGAWLLINELDKLDPMAFNMLKPVLEDEPRLTILEEDYYEVITAHPDFRVVAACNTWARGDDTGMFVSSEIQDIADVRRFHAFIELDYPGADVETKILTSMFKDLSDQHVANFIKVANEVRDAFKVGGIGRTLSTAELVNWAENYLLFESVHHAARVSFLNAYEGENKQAVSELIAGVWGQEDMGV